MVTGDQLAIAVETCRRLGMGTNIMEGKELMSHATEDLSFAKKVSPLLPVKGPGLYRRGPGLYQLSSFLHVALAVNCCLSLLLCVWSRTNSRVWN